MKKKRTRLLSIFFLLAVTLIVYILAKPSSEQVYAKQFLNEFYTVSDFEICTYLTEDALNSSSSEFTDEGYDQFISDQIYAFYDEYALKNKCVFNVKSMNVVQDDYDSEMGIWNFSFTAELTITFKESDEIKTLTQTGSITILSRDGNMKIDSITIDNMDELI